jgi:hypothetical protein
MLAQASIVVFTTGLPGRPPTMQFPALPTEQDDGCSAKRTMRGKIWFPGQDTLLRPEDTKSETDMRSHLCRRDMRHFITFELCQACRSRPRFVQRSYCRGYTRH